MINSLIIKTWRRIKRFVRFLAGQEVLQYKQISISVESHGLFHGSWVIASNKLNSDSIIYSVGVGTDVEFDLSLISKYKVSVHAFDPTPRSIAWVKEQYLPAMFIFHPFGLASFDGVAHFQAPINPNFVSYSIVGNQGEVDGVEIIEAPVYRLSSVMKNLGHEHIDLLKMDIEGGEYEVVENMLAEGIEIDQILVEVHHRFASIDIAKTKELISLLNNSGYKIFHVSDSGEEYSFIKI